MRVSIDTDDASETMRAMADDMERTVREDIVPLAAVMEESFASASRSIADELEKAARSGTLSFRSMVQEVLADLAGLAADTVIRQPLEAALGQIFSGFGGGRAGGGFVAPGNAFLVGESGPEMFVPPQSGRIAPLGGGAGNVTVNLNMPQTGDAESYRRSAPQIAAALQRALARANRNG
uniref:Bacteriophage tail tape measure C-terminal domain-containing protein n=1 Tax=Aquisalinus luteolus TaxID=1566827 RepID=A0A8J3A432_9PROT|nr:hypothetical protein GCM10011355_32260 [Aquisalinus luteolus]